MAGAMYAMPLLVLNMGGEMLYVLQQRLGAQRVGSEKGSRVLSEVLQAMLGDVFLDHLLQPQEMYSLASARRIFERIAHASIMRLNATSMDKLHDLMLMAVKQQVLACRHPREMLQVTKMHLAELAKMTSDAAVIGLTDSAGARLESVYGAFSLADWMLLKQTILRFLQPRHVKVSLFLQEGLQRSDGVLLLDNGGMLVAGASDPGRIRFAASGLEASFAVQFRNETVPFSGDASFHSSLGGNMYANIGASGPRAEALFIAPPSEAKEDPAAETKRGSKDEWNVGTGSATDELNLLARLMGSIGTADAKDGSGAKDASRFRVNLFAEDPFGDSVAPDKASGDFGSAVKVDAAALHKGLHAYKAELEFDDAGGSDAKDDKADSGTEFDEAFSLLDLMDSAK